MNETILSFISHLEELRLRLIKSAIAVSVSAVVVYNFSQKILSVLAQPVGKLVFLSPTEAFIVYLKISLWGGLFLASPVVIYQIWRFISAGLKWKEKKYIYIFMPASLLLFLIGVLFGFFVIMGYGIKFLLSFGTDFMVPMISVSKYVSFLSSTLLAFGVVFQLPLVLFLLATMGLVTPQFLAQKRRYAIVIIFLVAGVVTPSPDVFCQFVMAVPLLVLYEAGIILTRLAKRQAKNNYKEKQEAGVIS